MVAATLTTLPLTAAVPLAGLLGLVVGSFVATLVLRWEAGDSVRGRSRCDDCGRTLTPWELVPLVGGWRGDCATCGTAIDPLHRRTELGAAALAMVAVTIMPGAAGWLLALFGWLLLPLALLDARHFWLPDALVMPLAVTGLVLAGPMLSTSIADRMVGAAAGGFALGGISWLFTRLRGQDGMGGGDPKLAAALGAWLGWLPLPAMIFLSSGAGIIWAVLTHKGDGALKQRPIPYGVFLAAAAWLAVPLWHYFIAR